MDNNDNNIIKFQSKFSQNCRSCSKLISLNEKITYLCSKCQNYFCEECALFLHENPSEVRNNCPGGEADPHDSIMVKITRNIKEYLPIGISIDDLEKNPKKYSEEKSTVRVLESNNDQEQPKKKPSIKILDD